MTHIFTDEEIRNLRLPELRDYLHRVGWSRVSGYGDNASIYQNGDGLEVLVPDREDLIDYVPVVRDVLTTLVRAHDTSAVRVYQDVVNQRRDVIRIVANDDGNGDGTIAPDAASELFTGAKLLWEAAVRSALENPEDAKDYWRDARFGQTERGSYVVTMLSPPVFLGVQIALRTSDTASTPARRVTNELMDVLRQTRSLVTELRDDDGSAVERAAKRGISYRICEALGRVLNPFGSISCQVYKTDPLAARREDYEIAHFVQDDVEYLKMATDQLKVQARNAPAEVSVHGYILRCERREDRDDGKVTLNVLMPDLNGVQTVHLSVSDGDYRQALQLHGQKMRVDARGELVHTAESTWQLHNAEIRKSPSENWAPRQPIVAEA